ncbi:MAG: (Fe-S)-binding protein [Desulfobacula sp.]|jgi:Fe-S oxidoreductase|uniref:(Fe-S)-binding protein n=1 Tax=Desulfobacula sp. TaxID=2593537 RepID=UPI001DC9708E|nr:(Fe-S)-binding protein [Desulfobacula sp.]MBT3486605.1 (Fe-S)-binding protein [Desulfobacula sp.]MBT3805690.1 (Fe-S)-binding protein [Desulfobacula sp.]MBT4023882.1 (Fe-S)-binding protein [Desulfobacula sp.]MBT4198992.1 (Fe-S)-binding protein [Desulfobacula sp.]
MNPLFMSILLIVGLAIFTRTMVQKIQLLMALEPTTRANHISERIKNVVIIALGQKRLVGRKKEWASGLMHAFIFWGFCVLLIRSLNLYGEGFVKGFQLPLFGDGSIVGYLYIALKDIMEGIVLLMAAYAIYRRAIVKPERLHNTWEAYFVLCMIGVLMISDLLLDGARYNLIMLHNNPGHLHFFNNPQFGSEFAWTPISVGAASLVSWMSADALSYLLGGMFWLHIITQLTFLNFLPLGKHFHVITALPNVFLKSLGYPHEKTKVLDLEDESVWEDESLGINHIHQLNWKQGLDLYTCTECGRCKEVCPTYTTDKPLSLHDLNDTLKLELLDNADNLIKRSKLAASIKADTDPEKVEEIKAQMAELNCKKTLIGEVISEETLWACTNCRACEQVCPVTIEQVPRIIALRQGQALMAGVYPQELNVAFRGLERNGNPWGIGYDQRAEWADGLNVKIMADDSDVDYLLWVGCAGSFDDRSKKVSISMVKILQKAGINFAILGKEEKCTGDFARRAGNEMMYQMMAQENIETLNNYKVKKIIAACPHCLNTLKHEYPQMGGNYEVIHHTDFIDQLIKSGKITLNKSLEGALTFHDPCFLGRYNSIYDQPRSILQGISKQGLTELDRHGSESFCCGAGGGRMWMEETIGKRINVERSEEIVGKNVANVAVACPFCLTMIEDGMKELDKDEQIKAKDICELVAENMA